MHDSSLNEKIQPDEKSIIERETISALAIFEQTTTSSSSKPAEIEKSASAPPQPIKELSDTTMTTDAEITLNNTLTDSYSSVSTVATSSLNGRQTDSNSTEVIVKQIEEDPVNQTNNEAEEIEEEILKEIKEIDQILDEFEPEELNELSLNEIISLKSATPLPTCAPSRHITSKLITSYDQYKAYLSYLKNGLDEQQKRGQYIANINRKVVGVDCGEPCATFMGQQQARTIRRPTFYQFLQQPNFNFNNKNFNSFYSNYPQNLLLNRATVQPNFQTFPTYQTSQFRGFTQQQGFNQQGFGQQGFGQQGFKTKGFTNSKPFGFYGF